ncbi:hypothetical protein ACR9PT_14250, partial [Piscirickettsia salmonis]|uniref:hypothetical protein n=1 Tax=Piscirickettsia salmonis TaxID=1238 RepID=UPI003EB6EA28
LPAINLDLKSGNVLDFSVVYNQRQVYNTVFAEYHDLKTANLKKVAVGSGDPTYTIPVQYSDESKAHDAADAQFNYFKRHRGQLSLRLIGDASIMSQFPLKISGFKSTIDKHWIVQKVTHQYTEANGYLTQVQATIAT